MGIVGISYLDIILPKIANTFKYRALLIEFDHISIEVNSGVTRTSTVLPEFQ